MEITVTDIAQREITRLVHEQEQVITGVRITAEATSPLQANHRLAFVTEGQITDRDTAIPFDGFNVYIDENSAPYTQDITLDFVDGLMGRGFKIDNPHKVPPHLKGSVAEKIQIVIDEKINPGIAAHGGRVSLINVKEDTAYLQFGGGCQGCGMVDVTLKQGVEVMIKEAVPEIANIRDITDHAEGTNPYYQTTQ